VTPKLKSGTVALYTHYLRGLAIPEIGEIKAEAVRRSDISKPEARPNPPGGG